MRILVTGGCGFIGHHTVRELLDLGHEVHVLDSRDVTAINWTRVESWIGANLHLGDVRSSVTVNDLFRAYRFDLVLHLAAQSHVDRSIADPVGTVDTNVVGTQVIVNACVRYNVPLVYCSTDEVYGDALDTGAMVVHHEGYRLNPSSPYSAGKAGGEFVVTAAGRTHGLKYAITRGTNAWGPGQYGEKLIPIIVHRLSHGHPVPLHGGGLQVRQWVAVEEFAHALATIGRVLADGYEPVQSQVYNIAGPVIYSVKDLVLSFAKVLGVEQSRAFIEVKDRPGQDKAYCVCGRALEDALGITPKRVITDELELTRLVTYYQTIGTSQPTLYEASP